MKKFLRLSAVLPGTAAAMAFIPSAQAQSCGRVIHCRTLMTPGTTVEGPTVDVSLMIEEVARVLSAEGKEAANVVNSGGKLLGSINMNDIIPGMVSPKADAAAEPG
ncbi:MAG: hypothetical protein Q8O85_17320 [Rhodoferax sp.]|uniref:hypothetical protein n=1 Tax=Rhodoferax sp. TaxID=50421 RepID=UPI00269A34DD|nr:hypothetical protein [Rhodoferax sp.]MDP2680461.1 hypothetical protein [Rhodoferax sp.]